jgi:hypothetical protein
MRAERFCAREGQDWTSVQVTARISKYLLSLTACAWRHTVE